MMFQKTFTIKGDTSIRNSEKKKLLARFPPIDGITNKTVAALMQIVCHKGENVNVYTFNKEPLLFGIAGEEVLYPTVYLTWKLPEAFPVLVTSEDVYRKLVRGADLFLQGVIRPLRETLEFGNHAPVAISVKTSANELRGPLAVGYSLMSSVEMIASGMQGPGVRLLHFHGDNLWDVGTHTQPPVVSAESTVAASPKSYETEFPSLGSLTVDEKTNEMPDKAGDAPSPIDTISAVNQESDELATVPQSQVEEEPQSFDSMENLLKRCFVAALTGRLTKKGQLPLDVGEFYSHYLLPCVPSDRRIDMKKTIYKKFSAFLEDVNKNENGPIVKIVAAKKQKGSEMITEVNWEHPLLKEFKTTDEKITATKNEEKKFKVEEYLAVTEPVSPIFREHFQKGNLLAKAQAKEIIKTFVKTRNPEIKGKMVVPSDEVLISLLRSQEPVDWNTLFQKITSRMTKTYVVTWADGRQLVRKVELPKIAFKIENRAGNRKVTLVNNLSIYGIDCKKFCHEIQTGVAASATIVNGAAQCEGPQILVQGNHILFISDLLHSKYGIDKKYMVGLELIPKRR